MAAVLLRDQNPIGRTIDLNGRTYTVIGVMPPSMNYPRQAELPKEVSVIKETDVWRPLALSPKERANRFSRGYQVLARLKQGGAIETARAEMSTIAAAIALENPNANHGWGVKLVRMQEQITGRVRPVLIALLASVGFVLLIACANVANLLLARGAARRREIAVRSALGAGRRRIVTQLLVESLILAIGGGILGVAIAAWSVRALVTFGPQDIPRLAETSIDPMVLLFALGATLVTGIVFGLFPALEASRTDLNESLKQGGRSSTTGTRHARGLLVVAEVALAVLAVDPGFQPASVLTFNIQPDRKYQNHAQVNSFYGRLNERLAALPGVEAVGSVNDIPLGGGENMEFVNVEGRPDPPAGQEDVCRPSRGDGGLFPRHGDGSSAYCWPRPGRNP